MTALDPPRHETRRAPDTDPGPDWRHQAACAGTPDDLFFPIGSTGPALIQAEEAKKVCARCPVRVECLSWALETGEASGVWGGLDEDERYALRKARKPWTRYSGGGGVALDILTNRRPDVDRLLMEGLSVGELARALGTNGQTVNKLLSMLEDEKAGASMGVAA